MSTEIKKEKSDKLNDYILHRTRLERLFLKNPDDGNAIENKYGVFAYQSADGNHIISLDSYLADYREWLIANKFVKEI